MTDHNPVAWGNLTPEEWRVVQKADHASLFDREEVRNALRFLVPEEEIAVILDEVYAEAAEPGSTFFYGDLLTALSLTSASAAERVRTVLNETDAEEKARIAEFRRAYPGF